MDSSTFSNLIHWVITHGYFLFFIAAFLEGPLITAAAGVAAALGYYNISIIILLSVLADLSADIVYYSIGYWSRETLIIKYGKFVGLTKELVVKTENLLHKHITKAMIIIKLSPLIPVPGLIIIGSAHVPLRRFVKTSLIITLPKSLLFGLIGYFSGKAYAHYVGLINNGSYILFGIIVLCMLVYFAYQKFSAYVVKELNRDKTKF